MEDENEKKLRKTDDATYWKKKGETNEYKPTKMEEESAKMKEERGEKQTNTRTVSGQICWTTLETSEKFFFLQKTWNSFRKNWESLDKRKQGGNMKEGRTNMWKKTWK